MPTAHAISVIVAALLCPQTCSHGSSGCAALGCAHGERDDEHGTPITYEADKKGNPAA